MRIEGRVERASAAWSDRYFAARARSSQIGAWASAQSQVIASRDVLEARIAEAEARFRGTARAASRRSGAAIGSSPSGSSSGSAKTRACTIATRIGGAAPAGTSSGFRPSPSDQLSAARRLTRRSSDAAASCARSPPETRAEVSRTPPGARRLPSADRSASPGSRSSSRTHANAARKCCAVPSARGPKKSQK